MKKVFSYLKQACWHQQKKAYDQNDIGKICNDRKNVKWIEIYQIYQDTMIAQACRFCWIINSLRKPLILATLSTTFGDILVDIKTPIKTNINDQNSSGKQAKFDVGGDDQSIYGGGVQIENIPKLKISNKVDSLWTKPSFYRQYPNS